MSIFDIFREAYEAVTDTTAVRRATPLVNFVREGLSDAAQDYGRITTTPSDTPTQNHLGITDTSLADNNAINISNLSIDPAVAETVPEFKDVVTWLDEKVYTPVYETAGFAALMRNPDTYTDENGNFTGDSINPINALGKAWDARKDISFGQTLFDQIGGDFLSEDDLNINIYNQAQRDKIYSSAVDEFGNRVDSLGNPIKEDSWLFKAARYGSGAIDLGKQLVFDPFFFAGKGLKAARLGNLRKFGVQGLDVTRGADEVIPDLQTFTKEVYEFEQIKDNINALKQEKIDMTYQMQNLRAMVDEFAGGTLDEAVFRTTVNDVSAGVGYKPLPKKADTDLVIARATELADNFKGDVEYASQAIDDLLASGNPKPTLARGINEFASQVVTHKMTWQEIANHRTIDRFAVDKFKLARALEAAGKYGEQAVADVLLLSTGDTRALSRLRTQHESLLGLIESAENSMTGARLRIERAQIGSAGDSNLVKREKQYLRELRNHVYSLKKDDEYLALLLAEEPGTGVPALAGSLTGAPFSSSRIVESFRANRARIKAGLNRNALTGKNIVLGTSDEVTVGSKTVAEFNWERVQRTPFHMPVYVAQWVGHRLGKEKPSGFLTVGGLDEYDGVIELRTWLTNSKLFDDNTFEIDKILNDYVALTSQSARTKFIEDVAERAVFERLATKRNVTAEAADGTPAWEILRKLYNDSRKADLTAFRENGFLAIDDQIVMNPVLLSQLDYSVPLLDVREVDRFMIEHSKDISRFTVASKTAGDAYRTIRDVYYAGDRLWRANVLLRLGYPQRNILSEYAVLSMYDDGLFSMFNAKEVRDSTVRWSQNRWAQFKSHADLIKNTYAIKVEGGLDEPLSALSSVVKKFNGETIERYSADVIDRLQDQRAAIVDEYNESAAAATIEPAEKVETLYHGTVSKFDNFDSAAARDRWGSKGTKSGGFYFTDNLQVANQWGPNRAYQELTDKVTQTKFGVFFEEGMSQAEFAENLAILQEKLKLPVTSVKLNPEFEGETLANRLYHYDKNGQWEKIAAEDLTPVDFFEGNVAINVFGSQARVITSEVFGKTLDLRPPGPLEHSKRRQFLQTIPEEVRAHYKLNDAADVNRFRRWQVDYGHDSDKFIVNWARENGYGKIRFLDSATESGGESYLVVPEAIDNPDFMSQFGPASDAPTFPTETVAVLDERIALENARLDKIQKARKAKGERWGTANIRGRDTITVRGYDFPGVYVGIEGEATRKLISSAGRTAFDMSPTANALREMGLEAAGQRIAMRVEDPNYYTQLTDIINKQFRGSPTVVKVLAGESDEEILAYLASAEGQAELNSLGWVSQGELPEYKRIVVGRDEVTDPTLIADTREENYLNFIRFQVVDNYLPTPEAQSAVARAFLEESQITSIELRRLVPRDVARPIAAEQLNPNGVMDVLFNPELSARNKLETVIFDRAIKKLFNILGAVPEDAFVSHPFGAATYQAKLDEIAKLWEEQGIKPTAGQVAQAQTTARKWAIQQSREYLYRVVRQNSISAAIPLLAPFANAQFSTFRRAGRAAWNNPDKAARLTYLWNEINTNSKQDEDGNRWYTIKLPATFYDDKGLSSLVPESLRNAMKVNSEYNFNVQSLNLLAAGLRVSTPDVLPDQEATMTQKVAAWAKTSQTILGTGPVVQILANEMIKNNPAINYELSEKLGVPVPAREFLEVFASPFPTANWYDPLLSAWNKRVVSLVYGPKYSSEWRIGDKVDNDWERTVLMQFQYHIIQQELGEEEPFSSNTAENYEIMWQKASDEASAQIALRLFVNLGSGFIPTYEGELSPYVRLYRQYQEKYGPLAYDRWVADYPDYAILAASRSKNISGSSQTTEAVWKSKKYDNAIDKALYRASPLDEAEALQYKQMVTNADIGVEVLRDPYAGFWQRENRDRLITTAQFGVDQLALRSGWTEYTKMMDSYNATLAERGLSPYSSKAKDLRAQKLKWIEEYGKNNPVWYTEYKANQSGGSVLRAVNFMKTMLDDKQFVEDLPEDSWWFAADEYVQAYDSFTKYLQGRGKGSASDAELEMFYSVVAPIVESNETFSYYFLRFLDSDTFATTTDLSVKGNK